MRKLNFTIETKPQPVDVRVLIDELASYAESRGLSRDGGGLAVFIRDRLSRVVGGVQV
jgi:hypothetical protein